MKTLLYLDDLHSPKQKLNRLTLKHFKRIVWVTNYPSFVEWIYENGLPDAVSFDHDLHKSQYAPEEHWVGTYRIWRKQNKSTFPTGTDCAKFLVKYCQREDIQLPIWSVHSLNPIGSLELSTVLMNYAEHFYKQQNKKGGIQSE